MFIGHRALVNESMWILIEFRKEQQASAVTVGLNADVLVVY